MMSRIYKIGRDERNDIVLNHPSIADFHAEIYLDPQRNCFFTDLQSPTGSKVNGAKVYDPVLLKSGDVLRLGENQLFDWELTFFNRKRPDQMKPSTSVNLAAQKSIAKTSADGTFLQKNLDLVLIFGAIIFFLLLLNWIM